MMEAELFAAFRRRPAPSGRALLCAADNARKIQGITASQKRTDARNRAPVTPVSLHISDVSAQRKVIFNVFKDRDRVIYEKLLREN